MTRKQRVVSRNFSSALAVIFFQANVVWPYTPFMPPRPPQVSLKKNAFAPPPYHPLPKKKDNTPENIFIFNDVNDLVRIPPGAPMPLRPPVPVPPPAPAPAPAPPPPPAPPPAPPAPPPAPPRTTSTEIPITRTNYRQALRALGYTGRWRDVANVQIPPGARIFRDENGRVRIVGGAIRWRLRNGLQFTASNATGTRQGIRLQINAPGGGTRNRFVFTEVNNRGQVISRTVYRRGHEEVRVNNEIISFSAPGGAILRTVITRSGGNARGGAPPVRPHRALSGNVGDYVIRQGNIDSTFRMVGGRVTLMQMQSNIDDFDIVAYRDGSGFMRRGIVALDNVSIERVFWVANGPVIDQNSGQVTVAYMSYHNVGETRTYRPPPAPQPGAPRSPPQGNALPNLRMRHVEETILGDGRIQRRATANNAIMTGTLSLNGSSEQRAATVYQHYRLRHHTGTVLAESLEGMLPVADRNRHTARPMMFVHATDNPTRQLLARIGVQETIPTIRNAQSRSVNITRTAGLITRLEIGYSMQGFGTATQIISQRENRTVLESNGTDTNFDIGTARIHVPRTASHPITINQSGLFEARTTGTPGRRQSTYTHLNGVRVTYRVPVTQANGTPGEREITVELNSNARGELQASVNSLGTGQLTFAGEDFNISNRNAVFAGGRIFFRLTSPITLRNRELHITDSSRMTNATFTGTHVSIGLNGLKTLSSEVRLRGSVGYQIEGASGPGMATPGASSENIRFYTHGDRQFLRSIGPNARVAALVTDQGGRLNVQFNPTAENSNNVEVYRAPRIQVRPGVTLTQRLGANGNGWAVTRLMRGAAPIVVRQSQYTLTASRAGNHQVTIDGVHHILNVATPNARLHVDNNRLVASGRYSGTGTANLRISHTLNSMRVVSNPGVTGRITGDLTIGGITNGEETQNLTADFPIDLQAGPSSTPGAGGWVTHNVDVLINGQRQNSYVLRVSHAGGHIRFDGRTVTAGNARVNNWARLERPISADQFQLGTGLSVTDLENAVIGEVRRGSVNENAPRGFQYTIHATNAAANRTAIQIMGRRYILVLGNGAPRAGIRGTVRNDGRGFNGGRNSELEVPADVAVQTGQFVLPPGVTGRVTGNAVICSFNANGEVNRDNLRGFQWEITLTAAQNGTQIRVPVRGGHGRYQIQNGRAGDRIVYDGRQFTNATRANGNLQFVGSDELTIDHYRPVHTRQAGHTYSLREREVLLSFRGGTRRQQDEHGAIVRVTANASHTGTIRNVEVRRDGALVATRRWIQVPVANQFRLIQPGQNPNDVDPTTVNRVAMAPGSSIDLVNGYFLTPDGINGNVNVIYQGSALNVDGATSRVTQHGFAAFVNGRYVPQVSMARYEVVSFHPSYRTTFRLTPQGSGREVWIRGEGGSTVVLQRGGNRGPDLTMSHGDLRWQSVGRNDGITRWEITNDPRLGRTVRRWQNNQGQRAVNFTYHHTSTSGQVTRYGARHNGTNFERNPAGTAWVIDSNGRRQNFTINRDGIWIDRSPRVYTFAGNRYNSRTMSETGVRSVYVTSWGDRQYRANQGEVLHLITPRGVIVRTDVGIQTSGNETNVVDLNSVSTRWISLQPTMQLRLNRTVSVVGVTRIHNRRGSVQNLVRAVGENGRNVTGTIFSYAPNGVLGTAVFNGRFISGGIGGSRLRGHFVTNSPQGVVIQISHTDPRRPRPSNNNNSSSSPPSFNSSDPRHNVDILSYRAQHSQDEHGNSRYRVGTLLQVRGRLSIDDGNVHLFRNTNLRWVRGGHLGGTGSLRIILSHPNGTHYHLATRDTLRFSSNGAHSFVLSRGRGHVNGSYMRAYNSEEERWTSINAREDWEKTWYGGLWATVLDHPLETAVFAVVLTVGILAAIPSGGTSLGLVGTYVFGMGAVTGIGSAIWAGVVIAGTALSFAMITNGIINADYAGERGFWRTVFFYADVALQALPIIGAGITFLRGGRHLMHLTTATSTLGRVRQANALFSAARTAGVQGVGIFRTTAQGLRNIENFYTIARSVGASVDNLGSLARFANASRRLGGVAQTRHAAQIFVASGGSNAKQFLSFSRGLVRAGATADDLARAAHLTRGVGIINALNQTGQLGRNIATALSTSVVKFKPTLSAAGLLASQGAKMGTSAVITFNASSVKNLISTLITQVQTNGVRGLSQSIQTAIRQGKISAAEGLVVLATVLHKTKQGKHFFRLGLRLTKGHATLRTLLRTAGDGAGLKALVVKLAQANETGAGLLSSLTRGGALTLGKALANSKTFPAALRLFGRPGGRELGSLLAVFLNTSGKHGLKFLSQASKGTIKGLQGQFVRLAAAGSDGQNWVLAFGQALRAGKGQGAHVLGSFLNQLGEIGALTFLRHLGTDGIKSATQFLLKGHGNDLLKHLSTLSSSQLTKAIGNLGRTFTFGKQAARAYLQANVQGAVALLSKLDADLITGLFRGLAEGGAKAGRRLAQIKDLPTFFTKVVSMTAASGVGGKASEIAFLFGQGLGRMGAPAFNNLIGLLNSNSFAMQSFIRLLAFGGEGGAKNVMDFLSAAGRSGRHIDVVLRVSGGLKGNQLGHLIGALGKNGGANIGHIIDQLSAIKNDKVIVVLINLITEGRAGGAAILRELTPEAAKHFGRGLANLIHSGGSVSTFLTDVFRPLNTLVNGISDAATLGKRLDVFGKSVSSLLEKHGLALAARMAEPGSMGKRLGAGLGLLFKKPDASSLSKAASLLGLKGSKISLTLGARARSNMTIIRSALSGSGREAFEAFLNSTSGKIAERLFSGLNESGRKAIIAAFNGENNKAVAKFFSSLDLKGAKRVSRYLGTLSSGRSASFLSGLDNGINAAGVINRATSVGASNLSKLLHAADLSENGLRALGRGLDALSDAAVSHTFLRSLTGNTGSVARLLSSLSADGAIHFSRALQSLSPNGTRILSDLLRSTSFDVLKTFFNTLNKTGADNFASLLNGLKSSGEVAMKTFFKSLQANGAKVFAQILNAVEDSKGLIGLFNDLTQAGAKTFASFLNGATGKVAENIIAMFKALDGNGGKALAAIFNKGKSVLGNLNAFFGSLSEKTAGLFGRVLNGLTDKGAAALAEAFVGFTIEGAKKFASFIKKIGEAEKLSAFINGLGQQGGKVLSAMMNKLSRSAMNSLSKLFQALEAAGAERFGQLLSQLKASRALNLVNQLTKSSIKGLAGFLNSANAKTIEHLSQLLSNSKVATNTLRLFELGGEAAGKAFAKALSAAGDDGVKVMSELLKNDEFTETLAKSLATMSDEGAQLFGALLKRAHSADDITEIQALMKAFQAADAGGELGRLFQFLGERGIAAQKLKKAISEAVKMKGADAGFIAGKVLHSAVAKAGIIGANEAVQAGRAMAAVIGSSKNKAFIRGAMKGLFGAGKAVRSQKQVDGLKQTIQFLLSADSGLSGGQKAALRQVAKKMFGHIDDLRPLFKFTSARPIQFVAEAARYRWQNFVYLISEPETYFRLMHKSAINWSIFGFSGVGMLLPFGYTPQDGWYWGWKDPTKTHQKAEFSWSRFGRMLTIVFTEYQGEYLHYRLMSMKDMYLQGKRIGNLLHIAAFQPMATNRFMGFFEGVARRGGVGSMSHYAVRTTNATFRGAMRVTNGARGLFGGRALGTYQFGLPQFNLSALVHGGLERGFSRTASLVSQRLARSGFLRNLAHTAGTYIGGAEGVMIIHTATSMGMFAGWELGGLFLGTEFGQWLVGTKNEKQLEHIRHELAHAGSMIAMFLTPMPRFRNQLAQAILEPTVRQGRSSSQARVLAEEILSTNGMGTAEVMIGFHRVRLHQTELAQLHGLAAQAMIRIVAEGKNGNANLVDLFNTMSSPEGETRQQAETQLRQNVPELLDFNFSNTGFREALFNYISVEILQTSPQNMIEQAFSHFYSRASRTIQQAGLTPKQVETRLVDTMQKNKIPVPGEGSIQSWVQGLSRQTARQTLIRLTAMISLEKSNSLGSFLNGKRVSSSTQGATRIHGALRERILQQYNAQALRLVSGRQGIARFFSFFRSRQTNTLTTMANSLAGTELLIGRRRLLVTTEGRTQARTLIETLDIQRENKKLESQVRSQARNIERDIFSGSLEKKVDALAAGKNETTTTLADLGLTKHHGFETLSIRHFRQLLKSMGSRQGTTRQRALNDMALITILGESLKDIGPFKGWKPGQFFTIIESFLHNIDMAAGGGKTGIMVVRAIIEATKAERGNSAVWLIAENPESVDNLLGKGGPFDIVALGRQFGIEVMDMRLQLESVRGGNKTIESLINDVSTHSQQFNRQGPRRRRIAVIDFDTLGTALSEFKVEGFTEAYTNSQVRIFDEVHRVTADPVMYVIGGGNGMTARDRAGFRAMSTLEEATIARSPSEDVGLMTIGGREVLRVRGLDGTIHELNVYRSLGEFRNAEVNGEAAVFIDVTISKAGASVRAARTLRRALNIRGPQEGLNENELQSFFRGRLAEENFVEVDMQLVPTTTEDGRTVNQYRPIQRGLGVRESQVVDDFSHLMGLNARRRELHRGKSFDLFMRDTGEIQVLETLRGVSRYTFFEQTGEALSFNMFRGFTATSLGFEGFIQLATGKTISRTLSNSVHQSIANLHGLTIVEGDQFQNTVVRRAMDVAKSKNGVGVFDAESPTVQRGFSRRLLLGTEDANIIRNFIHQLESANQAHRLIAKEWAFDTTTGEAVRTRDVGVTVEQGASGWQVKGSNASRFRIIRRVIDNNTAKEMVQAIVKSFQEADAIVISNQRGLTGKNFQGEGTIILADPHATAAELVQNLERVGRTNENGQGRWAARREVFTTFEFLEVQLTNAFAHRTQLRRLFLELTEQMREIDSQAANEIQETGQALNRLFYAAEKAMQSGVSIRSAIRQQVQQWSKSRNQTRLRGNRNGLLMMSSFLNLIERNTQTARSVVNEVFFHLDLERPLNEAYQEGRRSQHDTRLLEQFEKEIRNQRQRSQEEIDNGTEVLDAQKQIEQVSNQSRERAIAVLSRFLQTDGRRLSSRVYRILHRQLKTLMDGSHVTFRDAIRGRVGPNESFGSVAQNVEGRDHFIQTRRLVFQRLQRHFAPSSGGKSMKPQTIMQVAESLQSRGAKQNEIENVSQALQSQAGALEIRNGQSFLTATGHRLVNTMLAIMDLDSEQQMALLSLLSHTNVIDQDNMDDASQATFSLNIALALMENNLLQADMINPFDNLIRIAILFHDNQDRATQHSLTRQQLQGFLYADIANFGLLESAAKNQKDLLSQLNAARSRVGVVQFLTWLTNQNGDSIPAPLQQHLDSLIAQQNAIETFTNSLIEPGLSQRVLNWFMKPLSFIGKGFWNWFMKGGWISKIAKGALIIGAVAGLGSALMIAGVVLPTLLQVGVVLGALMGPLLLLGLNATRHQRKLGQLEKKAWKILNGHLNKIGFDKKGEAQTRTYLSLLGLTAEQIREGAGIVTILNALKKETSAARGRLRFIDIATIVGAKPPKSKEQKSKTTQDRFQRWMTENMRTNFDLHPWIRQAASITSIAVPLVHTLLVWGWSIPFNPVILIGAMIIGFISGKNPMMDMAKKAIGIFRKEDEKEDQSETPIKDTFWAHSSIRWLSWLLGAKGDPDSFKVLQRVQSLIKKEEDNGDVKFSLSDLKNSFGGSAQRQQALLLLGYTPDQIARLETNLNQFTDDNGTRGDLARISVEDIMAPDFNIDQKLAELELNAIERGERSTVDSKWIDAVKKLQSKREKGKLTYDDIITIANGDPSLETFLLLGNGADPNWIVSNLNKLMTKARKATPSLRDDFLRQSLNSQYSPVQLSKPLMADNIDENQLMGLLLGINLIKSVSTKSWTATEARTHRQQLHLLRHALVSHVGGKDESTRELIRQGFIEGFGEEKSGPWVFVNDPTLLEQDFIDFEAELIVNQLLTSLKDVNQAHQLPQLYDALLSASPNDSIEQVLMTNGMNKDQFQLPPTLLYVVKAGELTTEIQKRFDLNPSLATPFKASDKSSVLVPEIDFDLDEDDYLPNPVSHAVSPTTVIDEEEPDGFDPHDIKSNPSATTEDSTGPPEDAENLAEGRGSVWKRMWNWFGNKGWKIILGGTLFLEMGGVAQAAGTASLSATSGFPLLTTTLAITWLLVKSFQHNHLSLNKLFSSKKKNTTFEAQVSLNGTTQKLQIPQDIFESISATEKDETMVSLTGTVEDGIYKVTHKKRIHAIQFDNGFTADPAATVAYVQWLAALNPLLPIFAGGQKDPGVINEMNQLFKNDSFRTHTMAVLLGSIVSMDEYGNSPFSQLPLSTPIGDILNSDKFDKEEKEDLLQALARATNASTQKSFILGGLPSSETSETNGFHILVHTHAYASTPSQQDRITATKITNYAQKKKIQAPFVHGIVGQDGWTFYNGEDGVLDHIPFLSSNKSTSVSSEQNDHHIHFAPTASPLQLILQPIQIDPSSIIEAARRLFFTEKASVRLTPNQVSAIWKSIVMSATGSSQSFNAILPEADKETKEKITWEAKRVALHLRRFMSNMTSSLPDVVLTPATQSMLIHLGLVSTASKDEADLMNDHYLQSLTKIAQADIGPQVQALKMELDAGVDLSSELNTLNQSANTARTHPLNHQLKTYISRFLDLIHKRTQDVPGFAPALASASKARIQIREKEKGSQEDFNIASVSIEKDNLVIEHTPEASLETILPVVLGQLSMELSIRAWQHFSSLFPSPTTPFSVGFQGASLSLSVGHLFRQAGLNLTALSIEKEALNWISNNGKAGRVIYLNYKDLPSQIHFEVDAQSQNGEIESLNSIVTSSKGKNQVVILTNTDDFYKVHRAFRQTRVVILNMDSLKSISTDSDETPLEAFARQTLRFGLRPKIRLMAKRESIEKDLGLRALITVAGQNRPEWFLFEEMKKIAQISQQAIQIFATKFESRKLKTQA